ncbi:MULTISPECIES: SDR family NAD(P)-dependent oxidoreductase [Microbacterium]|uniref:SDR family NAD(P)-dependent oxidoreductase n=1 Tax=Microbacterium wangchenii TaxID=2541726 RepID=A0ABX5SYX3_9MICO|nr:MULTISPECIES: SDR family NAD(P)-dependent oxidoreductase [Microbacterium]MCK6066034.1 SDR family NAD(P)-dependent oxidoreductase [Microbacterium sp. EYE_512]QBR90322.1 SDR family NAD(P)-dependent oxidoreductase [Microbacterium wangchenii]
MEGIKDWNGRVAVVTGGGSGIGKGIAGAFREAGATVVVADRDAAALERARAEGYPAFNTDVTEAEEVSGLADEVLARFGRVDLMVNNAGVGPKAAAKDLTLEDWRWVLDVNLMGVVHGVQAFLPALLANPHGAWMVNTASMSRFFTPPGYAPYVASKAAVEGLSLTIAAELEAAGDTVGVTVLHPGAVRSNIKDSLRNRPAGSTGGLVDFDIAQKITDTDMWIEPEEAGAIVLRAVRNGDRYAFTHPNMLGDVESSFAGVRDAMTRYS